MALGIGATLGISAGSALLSGIGGWLASEGMYGDTVRKYNKRASKTRDQYNEGLASYQESVEGMGDRGEDILDRYENMSPQDFYSGYFDSVADEASRNITAQTAIASNAISRGVTASGGDVTGQSQSAIKSLQEKANTSISSALRGIRGQQFQAGMQEKRFQIGRGDRYISQGMQGEGNLAQMYGQDARQAEMLAIQAEQAKNQSMFDIANLGMGIAGQGLNFAGQQGIAEALTSGAASGGAQAIAGGENDINNISWHPEAGSIGDFVASNNAIFGTEDFWSYML